jgi:hypothetical protein
MFIRSKEVIILIISFKILPLLALDVRCVHGVSYFYGFGITAFRRQDTPPSSSGKPERHYLAWGRGNYKP